MGYKSKLQTNNTELEGNNVDLQSILNTINSLPNATEAINLDAEITTQESLIDQIQAALEGKAGNNLDTSDATATVEDIVKDKTAYVNGEKIIGTHECSGGKTTKTIVLDWSGDYEGVISVKYIASDFTRQTINLYDNVDTIEAEGGIIILSSANDSYCDNGFVYVGNDVYMAKQDGATVYLVSSGTQEG